MHLTSPLARRLLPLALLAIGIGISIKAGLEIEKDTDRDAIAAFNNEADDLGNHIVNSLQTLALVVRGAAGAFADPANPQPGEWKILTLQLQPQLTLPGVQGIGFSQVVKPDQMAAHVAKVRSWGFPDYTITPEGARDFYTSIIFLEPFEGRNVRAFGFDMFSEPVRRAAMERARDSGMPSLSGKVTLIQEEEGNSQPGVLLYFPLYRQGPVQAGEADRNSTLLGWTYSALRMQDFVNGVLGEDGRQRNHQINLFIYDGSEVSDEALLYTSVPGGDPLATHGRQGHTHKEVDFAGHHWTLVFDYSAALAQIDHSVAWLIGGAGLVISGLLYFLLMSLLSVQERSRKIANELTAQLRQKQDELVASEYRWKAALKGAGDGVWDWDVPSGKVFYSASCMEMLGYGENEIAPYINEWQIRIHPQDHDRVMAAVQDCLEGRTDEVIYEHRLRTKSDGYCWVLSRGKAVARDKDGKALRLLGTLKDISREKRTEELLRNKQHELLEAQRIAQVGSWKLDLTTNAVEWSAEMFHMVGLDPAKGAPDFDTQKHLFTAESWQRLSTTVARTAELGVPYELELEMIRPDGGHSFMLAHGEAERGSDGRVIRLRGTAADITSRVISKRRIEMLTSLYAALSACQDAVLHCETPEQLFARACEIVVRHGKVAMAWIGMLDAATGRIEPRYWAGEGIGYLDGIEVSVRADDPHGLGPSGTATRENRPVWLDNFRTDPRTTPWQARAMGYGWSSSASVPLCRDGKPIGSLTFYSTEQDWFTPEIRTLLEEISHSLSYALDKFDAEEEARRNLAKMKEAEQRFRSLVEQSLVGTFIVQERRFVYVSPHMETLLGYPHDGSLLQVTPAHIVRESDRPSMQTQVDRIIAGEIGNIEYVFTAVRKDGSTLDVGSTISGSTYLGRPALIGLLQDISNRSVAEAHIKRYASNLEKVFMQTVGMATNLVEMRDPYTAGHEKHVAEIAVAIGRELQLSQHQLEGLEVGGYLHDVGKISIPAEILAKPGRITPLEYELIKNHPAAGYQILKDVEFPWPVADIAHQHHERIDGSGYPRGLKGDDILLEARIVAVADVVESMSSHRPYRVALGIERALAEIEEGRGTRYDDAVVDACLRLFREKNFKLPG